MCLIYHLLNDYSIILVIVTKMADADQEVDPLEESMGNVSITKRKLEQAKEQDAQVEAEV